MKLYKLNEEQRDLLGQAQESGALQVVLDIIEHHARHFQDEVLGIRVSEEKLHELGYAKARSEGAWMLCQKINQFLEERKNG